MTPEEQQNLHTQVVRVAKAILNRSVGITEGARRLTGLASCLGTEKDSDFTVFVGIDSETDQFPLGAVRNHWNSKALARYDAEREKTEDQYRRLAEEACRNLIQKYEHATS